MAARTDRRSSSLSEGIGLHKLVIRPYYHELYLPRIGRAREASSDPSPVAGKMGRGARKGRSAVIRSLALGTWHAPARRSFTPSRPPTMWAGPPDCPAPCDAVLGGDRLPAVETPALVVVLVG